jgi:hypothetical protein
MTTLLKEPGLRPERAHAWEVARVRRNVGGLERGLRIGAGLACLFAMNAVISPLLYWGLAGLGAFLVITGVTGYCPFSTRLGRDTYHRIKREPPAFLE